MRSGGGGSVCLFEQHHCLMGLALIACVLFAFPVMHGVCHPDVMSASVKNKITIRLIGSTAFIAL
jgi:hypothetical protein